MVLFGVAALAVAGWTVYSFMRTSPDVAAAENQMFVDVETGRAFHKQLTLDLHVPCPSPFTGKATGYPAELCYWTKDGQPKTEPTAVVLNELVGKSGATFCPDCGRLVVHHNPAPGPGVRPPPTREESDSRGAG